MYTQKGVSHIERILTKSQFPLQANVKWIVTSKPENYDFQKFNTIQFAFEKEPARFEM